MALSDLTDPAAVEAALDEFDQLERDSFLDKYGFARARRYFLLRGGKRYDSKAIVGAAHGYQLGTPLRAAEFSGGEETVANKLESLGFDVVREDGAWQYAIGDITTRADIHGIYGGAPYGGIEPTRRTPNVMIYTDPEQGALNGYDYDGWDGNDPNVFYYTGEGRHGNQQMREGNKAVLEHADAGRTIRLFETVDEPQRPGGKRQRYLGAFYVDAANPYRMAPAPDAAGDARQVIVFRLIREGEESLGVKPAPPASGTAIEPPATEHHAGPASASEEMPEVDAHAEDDFTGEAEVTLAPSEQSSAVEYELQPRTGQIAHREEGQLVAHFETWLRQQGHDVQRARIRIPGERHELVTDSYDTTDNVLYEAKSRSERATVRLAIGQLLDYLRFVPDARGRLLLPEEPNPDIKRLIHSCGFGLAFRRLGTWIIEP